MASLIDTKNRLNSTKSTQKVIKAMELVASSKIRKAREKALGIQFFYETTLDAMADLNSYVEVKNYLHKKDAQQKTLFVAITSDMGLCGAYNSNITKALLEEIAKVENCETIVVGSKGVSKLNYEQKDISLAITNYNSMQENDIAMQITEEIIKKHNNKEISNVKVIYTKFVNALVQHVEVVDLFDFSMLEKKEHIKPNITIEPDVETVFTQLLQQYVYSVMYASILQSFASEHSYRRNSMESANKNSLELIDQLNLDLNRIRQALITQEISEIIGGSEALNN